MRIALITPGFSADAGDWAIPALQSFALKFAKEHALHVFSLRYPAAARYEWDDFTHHAIGGGQRYGLASLNIWRQTLGAIIRQHHRTPFDVLHAFWADEPGLVAVLAAALTRKPVVVSIGGGELSNLPDINYGTQRSFIRSQIIRCSFSRARVVTAGSNYMLKVAQQQKLDMAKVRLVPLGVDTGQFKPGQIPAWERPTIIQAASLTPVKNQALLIETLALIKKEIPNIRLLLVGEGPLKPQLELLAQKYQIDDAITFSGAVSFEAMPQFLQQGHLYIQTSRHESQGMAVLEAMACGLPVLGTPVGVAAELACLPATDDPVKLAAQATKVLSHPIFYEKHRRKARWQVVEEYSLNKIVQRFSSIYFSLNKRQ